MITVDATSSGQGTGVNSKTVSHVCSGADRILIVGVSNYDAGSGGNDKVTGVTYNGVAMTLITKTQGDGADSWNYLYALVAPDTGTHNIVVSTSTTQDEINVVAASYNGAKQTGQPDAYVINNQTSSVTSITPTLTTLTNNCWLVSLFVNGYGGAITAGTGTTLRVTATQARKLMDSNGSVGNAGSYSLNATQSSAPACAIMCSIAVAETNVTVSATVVAATFSIPTVTVTAIQNATISPNAQSATFSSQAVAISGGAIVSSSVLSATFSLPAPNIITPDSIIYPNAVSAIFSMPTPAVGGGSIIDVGVLTATFSIPSSSVEIGATIDANTLNATFSIETPTVNADSNITINAGVQTATFNIETPTITAETNAMFNASVISLTFSIQSPTITAERNMTVDSSVVSATFSVLSPRKVGGLWTAQPRVQGTWTPQPRII